MPYLTRLDLEQRFGVDEVAQRESALQPGGLDKILVDASSMIDGYLASRYTLPLTAIPEQLVATAAAIARYKLLGDVATEYAQREYKDAVAWLRDIAAGKVVLEQVAKVPGNSPATVVMSEPGERVFGRRERP